MDVHPMASLNGLSAPVLCQLGMDLPVWPSIYRAAI